MDRYRRTVNLTGEEGFEKLRAAKVLIIGVGGVGSYAAEAIARSGIGDMTLMDGDVVEPSNINRQLVALTSTVGINKAVVMCDRIIDMDPDRTVTAIDRFYEDGCGVEMGDYDFVVDAVDSVDAKVSIIRRCLECGTRVISSMGAAGKIQNEGFVVADISRTHTCPLAKVMRRRLREIGIEHVPVVFSGEKPAEINGELGTMSYVPGTAGLVLAGYVIRTIIHEDL